MKIILGCSAHIACQLLIYFLTVSISKDRCRFQSLNLFEFIGHPLKATILKRVRGLICEMQSYGAGFVAAIRSRHYLSKPRFGSLKPKGDLASSTHNQSHLPLHVESRN